MSMLVSENNHHLKVSLGSIDPQNPRRIQKVERVLGFSGLGLRVPPQIVPYTTSGSFLGTFKGIYFLGSSHRGLGHRNAQSHLFQAQAHDCSESQPNVCLMIT